MLGRLAIVLVVLCASLLSAQSTSTALMPIPPILSTPFPGGVLGPLVNAPNAPFCATVLTGRIQNLADGNRIQQTSSERICRDSKGRTRREMDPSSRVDGTSHGPRLMTTISDPIANVAYTLNERQRTAWKHPMRIAASGSTVIRTGDSKFTGNSSFSNFLLTPNPNSRVIINGKELKPPDFNVEDLGEDSINGFPAKGTRITRTIPAGEMGNEQPMKVVTERWFSETLKMTLRTKQSDPRMGDTLTELTNISTAEPDPSLFQVPADYTIEDPPNLRVSPTPSSSNPQ